MTSRNTTFINHNHINVIFMSYETIIVTLQMKMLQLSSYRVAHPTRWLKILSLRVGSAIHCN